MIIFHTSSAEKASTKLEDRLKEMVVAYKKVEHEKDSKELPYIEEDGKQFVSDEEISDWLLQLERDLNWSRSLSGDGCYVGPDKDKKGC